VLLRPRLERDGGNPSRHPRGVNAHYSQKWIVATTVLA
jgi:hypothetical protein